MATIPQTALFEWDSVEDIGDLIRLRFVVDHLPDEPLMYALESRRGNGRNEYPIRAIWNSILAGVSFSHETIESLRRELQRNGQLRDLCGFDPLLGLAAVPPSYVYSRFLSSLIAHQHLIDQMFERLVNEYGRLHEDFGNVLAMDGKALPSYASGERKNGCARHDHRGEHDARWGKHEYRGTDEKGTPWKTVKSWFGFTLHLLVDATHELPVGYEITDASVNEMPVANLLVDSMAEDYPWLADRCEYLCGDRGLDDGKLVAGAWDKYQIKPVIDIRNCWQDADETKRVPSTENVVYDFKGTVKCVCPRTGKEREMAYGGFEKNRTTHKYRCPARHYGYECAGMSECAITHSVRIPLSTDRRVFTPLARSTYKWPDVYDRRTAVERVNSRLDTSFGFEHHTIRGLHKMTLRVSIAFCVMLAIAIGWTKKDRPELVRCLLKAG
jgi:hypothetical protein